MKKVFSILLLFLFSLSSVYSDVNIIPTSGGLEICYDYTNSSYVMHEPSFGACISSHSTNYNFDPANHWLLDTSCNVDVSGSQVRGNFAFNTNQQNMVNALRGTHDDILNANLWMQTSKRYILKKDGSPVDESAYSIVLLTDQLNSTMFDDVMFDENYVIANNLGDGNYGVYAELKPIDDKCDFNGGGISLDEAPLRSILLTTFTVSGTATTGGESVALVDEYCWNGLLKDGDCLEKPAFDSTINKFIVDTDSKTYFRETTSDRCYVGEDGFFHMEYFDSEKSENHLGYSYALRKIDRDAYLSFGTDAKGFEVATRTYGDGTTSLIQLSDTTIDSPGRYVLGRFGIKEETIQVAPGVFEIQRSDTLDFYPLFSCDVKIMKDSDNDYFDDEGSLGKGHDWCLNSEPGTVTNDNFQGCQYEYSIDLEAGGCTGKVKTGETLFGNSQYDVMTFTPRTNVFECKSEGSLGSDYVALASSVNCHVGSDENSGDCGNLDTGFPAGTGRYVCVNEESWFPLINDGNDRVTGYCDLRHNAIVTCNNSYITLSANSEHTMYRFKRMLPSEANAGIPSIFKSLLSCDGTGQFTPGFNFEIYGFSSYSVLSEDYMQFERDSSTGMISRIDNETLGKVSCDISISNCLVKLPDGDEPITLPIAQNNDRIEIYKDGDLLRTESVDPELVALNIHNIRDFKSVEQVDNYLDNSVTLMNKFDIKKNLTYNPILDKTNVKIDLANFDDGNVKDLTIFQIIPKNIAADFSDIDIISNGGGQLIVYDQDPVIGWYFNDSDGDETIEFEVPGESEGGTIIISQEPILFNEGELVIKYREEDCNVDEITLFELDDLEASSVYGEGADKLYKVCISHINDSFNMVKVSGSEREIEFASFTNTDRISLDPELLENKLVLGVDGEDVYWSVEISKENPNGDYSCIGSFEDSTASSLFGDCGYNEDERLWIHVGEDITAPTTVLTTELVAHTIPVTLTSTDDIAGSGINGTYYCVDSDNSCNPINEENYVEGGVVEFSVTCPDAWGCIKYVRFAGKDNAGNIEEVVSADVNLIDVGSACQADCTVKPAPNRFLKGCNNLNSCEYYNYDINGLFDDGVYVAELCDLSIEGSYVAFNSSHEIKCPSGPFRKSRYASEEIDTSRSLCLNLQSVEYPAIVDGENVMMRIFVCVDKYQ